MQNILLSFTQPYVVPNSATFLFCNKKAETFLKDVLIDLFHCITMNKDWNFHASYC